MSRAVSEVSEVIKDKREVWSDTLRVHDEDVLASARWGLIREKGYKGMLADMLSSSDDASEIHNVLTQLVTYCRGGQTEVVIYRSETQGIIFARRENRSSNYERIYNFRV